jgi:exonuclease VII large subunit
LHSAIALLHGAIARSIAQRNRSIAQCNRSIAQRNLSQSLHCTAQSLHCTAQSLNCTAQSLHCTAQSLHCTAQSLHCTAQSLHCTAQSLHCTAQWAPSHSAIALLQDALGLSWGTPARRAVRGALQYGATALHTAHYCTAALRCNCTALRALLQSCVTVRSHCAADDGIIAYSTVIIQPFCRAE